jgi:hypothetical protein
VLAEALEADPEDGLAPVLLGALMTAMGRDGEATALRERVLSQIDDPEDRDVLKQQFDSAYGQARDARAAAGEAPAAP